MTTWTIVVRPAINAELDAKDLAFAKKLEAIHGKSHDRVKKGISIAAHENFEAFRAAMDSIAASPHPLDLVDFFSADANGNKYYVKVSGEYSAYYAMEEIGGKGSGILLYILYQTKQSKAEVLAALEASLKAHREDHV